MTTVVEANSCIVVGKTVSSRVGGNSQVNGAVEEGHSVPIIASGRGTHTMWAFVPQGGGWWHS